jgi:hypothetical protein
MDNTAWRSLVKELTEAGFGERKLFITPSIPTRSLLVQDENGIRVSPEKLVKQVVERQPVMRRGKRQRLQ